MNKYDDDDAGKIVAAPGSSENAARKAKAKSQRAQMKGWEADLRVVGNPAIQSKATVTLEKCGEMLDGDWRISSVRHEISGSGYQCSLKLVRPQSAEKAENMVVTGAAAAGSPDQSSDAGTNQNTADDDSIEVNLG